MAVNWSEVNKRRISEKTQEILLYCAQKKEDMTSRAFDLARLSVERLLDNIADRTLLADSAITAVRQSMTSQDNRVAICNEKQAADLARGVVYNYIGDDLNLYPITAEKKLLRAKARNQMECNILIEEMTTRDILYVASAIAEGENFSKTTMHAVFTWFREIGLDPYQTRVFSYLFMRRKPISLRSIPFQSLFSSEYQKAANELVDKGFICKFPGSLYCVTEVSFE